MTLILTHLIMALSYLILRILKCRNLEVEPTNVTILSEGL